jgi:hypothetical protein
VPNMWFCHLLPAFFHPTLCHPSSSIMLQMTELPSFIKLTSIPLCVQTMFSLFSHPLMGASVDYVTWLFHTLIPLIPPYLSLINMLWYVSWVIWKRNTLYRAGKWTGCDCAWGNVW